MTEIPYLGLFDIKAFLSHNNIPYWEVGKNVRHGWIGIQCLWCDDHSNHMGINPNTMGINCWRCSATGTVLKLVMKVLRVDLNTACGVVRDYSKGGEVIPKRHISTEPSFSRPDIDLMKEFKFTREMKEFQSRFLMTRRYDPNEVLLKYNLHFAGPVGEFARRIIIPVTFQRKIVSFVGRMPIDSNQPYKNCPGDFSSMDIKDTLYDIDNCKGSTVIVVEGIFDKWRIGNNVVATFGTKFSNAQVALLSGFKRVFILFDAEPDAQRQARDLATRLSIYTEVICLQLEDGDPDTMSDDDIKYLRKQVFKTVF